MKQLFSILIGILSFFSTAQDTDISQSTFFDGEPYLAMHPSNSQILTVSWIGFQQGAGIVIKTKNSLDGGNTWGNYNFLTIETGERQADPVLKYDSNGNLFLCYIDFNGITLAEGTVRLRKSTDFGATWGNSIEVINITDCPDQLCIDRPWMEIDTTGGQLDGTIYITTINANQPTIVSPPYHPYLIVSHDNGNSVQAPRFLDTTGYLAGNIISQPISIPTIDGNGVFKAIYPSYETSQSFLGEYYMASSNDGGVSITHSNPFSVTSGNGTTEAKTGRTLITNPTNGNHFVYTMVTEEQGDLNIYFKESFDAGLTWSNQIKVNDDPLGNGIVQDLVWIDFDLDGDLAFTWRDRRNGGTGLNVPSEIYCAIKPEGTSVVGPNFILNDSLVDYSPFLDDPGNDFMCTQFKNDTIHAVWGDARNGNINIFYNRYALNSNTNFITEITKPTVQIYPNPTSEYIFIEGDELSKIEIINNTGPTVATYKKNLKKIDVSNLPIGSYFIRCLLKNGEVYIEQFVKR
ncbi:MAG: T9SS type A sorting domain-containing protein [Lishizhenia sp.]